MTFAVTPARAAYALAVIALLSAPPAQAASEGPTCAATETAVPDERDETKYLCVSQEEWEKAREICARDAPPDTPVDPMACLCQDGDTVGACGD